MINIANHLIFHCIFCRVKYCFFIFNLYISQTYIFPSRLLKVQVLTVDKRKKRPFRLVSFFLAPRIGLEPTTARLTAACSTD